MMVYDDDGLLLETKQFVIDVLRIPDTDPDDIGENEPLFGEKLGLDSIDALALVVAVEKKYGAKIPDAASGREHLQSVGTLARFIEGNRKTQ